MKRTTVQRGECTYSFIYMTPTKTINNPKTTVKLKAIVPTNKDNYPQGQVGKGLLKYGSQSETHRQLSLIENHTRPKQRNTKQNIECPPLT